MLLPLLAALGLLCLRTPYSVLHGAIVGEEGTVYLRFAWDTPVIHALIAPHQGYYSLYANLCGIIAARVLPLEWAAHFLFFAEAVIQLLLVVVVLQCERLRRAEQKWAMILLALLAPPTASILISTVNAQFFLAVVTGVILISDASRLWLFRVLLLLFAGLNGVLTLVLWPLFVWQAFKENVQVQSRTSSGIASGRARSGDRFSFLRQSDYRTAFEMGLRCRLPCWSTASWGISSRIRLLPSHAKQ